MAKNNWGLVHRMVTSLDSLWRSQQQSRTLQEFRKEIRFSWNDHAAKELNSRYLYPHEEEDLRLLEALGQQVRVLEEANEKLVKIREHVRTANQLSTKIADILQDVELDIEIAYQHYDQHVEDLEHTKNYYIQSGRVNISSGFCLQGCSHRVEREGTVEMSSGVQAPRQFIDFIEERQRLWSQKKIAETDANKLDQYVSTFSASGSSDPLSPLSNENKPPAELKKVLPLLDAEQKAVRGAKSNLNSYHFRVNQIESKFLYRLFKFLGFIGLGLVMAGAIVTRLPA